MCYRNDFQRFGGLIPLFFLSIYFFVTIHTVHSCNHSFTTFAFSISSYCRLSGRNLPGVPSEILTRACHTASQRTTIWATLHPVWATMQPLSYDATSELRCTLDMILWWKKVTLTKRSQRGSRLSVRPLIMTFLHTGLSYCFCLLSSVKRNTKKGKDQSCEDNYVKSSIPKMELAPQSTNLDNDSLSATQREERQRDRGEVAILTKNKLRHGGERSQLQKDGSINGKLLFCDIWTVRHGLNQWQWQAEPLAVLQTHSISSMQAWDQEKLIFSTSCRHLEQ